VFIYQMGALWSNHGALWSNHGALRSNHGADVLVANDGSLPEKV